MYNIHRKERKDKWRNHVLSFFRHKNEEGRTKKESCLKKWQPYKNGKPAKKMATIKNGNPAKKMATPQKKWQPRQDSNLN